jgi:hypothetical protein
MSVHSAYLNIDNPGNNRGDVHDTQELSTRLRCVRAHSCHHCVQQSTQKLRGEKHSLIILIGGDLGPGTVRWPGLALCHRASA